MSSNAVDRALNDSIQETGKQLLALREDQWFERKSVRVAPKDLAVTLAAFANAEGGVVVVGLHDGKVEGIRGHENKVNALRQAAFDYTSPPVKVTFDQASVMDLLGEVNSVLVGRVQPGEHVYELTNGDCYLRVGDESRKLSFAQRQELHYDRTLATFDSQLSPVTSVTDLDQELLRSYRESAGASGTNTRLLRARGLVDDSGVVTNAGVLLFHPHPEDHFPQASVRVLRYRSTERGSGSRLTMDEGSDVRIEGPIPHVIAAAADAIRELQPRRRALTSDGTFEGVPVVPEDAWLEGIVNAVIHRSYSLAGDYIRVEIFPDRIEIQSPGRFPGLADPSKPLEISRYARNPRIARVCTDLRISQELGEGIRRMFDEMRERGLTDPMYVQGQGSVRLILSSTSRIPPEVLGRLPRQAEAVLATLRRAGVPLGTGEIEDAVGITRPTLLKALNALRVEDLIVWSGKSSRDPRATWSVQR